MKGKPTMQEKMSSPLQRMYFAAQRALRENLIPLLSALLFGLAAHMFVFSNKLMNADEVESLFGKGATITSGRWGLEAVKFIFPDLSMPWLYGIVSLLLLAVSACLIIRLFEIKSPLMQILLSAMITAFPSQTGVFCFMFTSTAYALSFILSVLCVWLFVKGGIVRKAGAIICLVLSLSIYQAYVAITAALFVLYLIKRCLDNEGSVWQNLAFAFRALGMMLLSLAVYYGISLLVFSLSGAQFNDYVKDNVNEAGILGRIRMAYDFLFYTLSYREFALVSGEMSRYLHIICLALCALLLMAKALVMVKEKKLLSAAFMLVCGCILPLAVYCMFLMMEKNSIHTLVLHGFIAFYVLAALLSDRLLAGSALLSRLGRDVLYLSFALVLMSNVFFANEAYLKLHLQYENAYSFYSILLDRVQSCEGYHEGTKLAIIGHQDNKLTRYPQIDLGYLMGPGQDLINIYSRENFLRRYMGTDIPLADEETVAALEKNEEFIAMAEYPYYGSVKKIDDCIVVKLG